MAAIDFQAETGLALFAIIRKGGLWWNGTTFVVPTSNADTFDVPIPESPAGSGQYGPVTVPGTGPGRQWVIFEKPSTGATPDFATCDIWGDGQEDISDDLALEFDNISGGGGGEDAGGGVLMAEINNSTLTPDEYLDIVQGEDKIVTFITTVKGRFIDATPTNITVQFRDTKKHVITVPNSEIERVCEEFDVQVFRAHLTPIQTATLVGGLAIIEITIDTQKAILKHSLRIIEDIES